MKTIVAITGGIGSGKSTALRFVAELGYNIISADDVNRELLSDNTYLELLEESFPKAFVDGKFDKKALSSIIFNDTNARLLLNSIAHKRIKQLVNNKIEKLDDDIIFVEVPLLIESGMIDMFDEIIVVVAGKEDKINRVKVRDGITKQGVELRMKSQLADDELTKVATYVINNDGTIDDLREKVKDVVDDIVNK